MFGTYVDDALNNFYISMAEKSFLFIRRRRRTNEPLLGLKWAPLHRRTSVAPDDFDDDNDEDPYALIASRLE